MNTAAVPQMWTIQRCSQETGLSYDAIRKLCLAKKIVHIKAGSKFLINYDKFIEFLNSSYGDGYGEEKENEIRSH